MLDVHLAPVVFKVYVNYFCANENYWHSNIDYFHIVFRQVIAFIKGMDPAILSASFQDFDAHLSRLEADYVQRLEAGFAQRSEAGYAQRSEAGFAQRLEAGYDQRSEAGYATGLEAGYPKNFFLPSSLNNNEGISFL